MVGKKYGGFVRLEEDLGALDQAALSEAKELLYVNAAATLDEVGVDIEGQEVGWNVVQDGRYIRISWEVVVKEWKTL